MIKIGLVVVTVYLVYTQIYFRGAKFLAIKEEIKEYTSECNELNNYIKNLRDTYVFFRQSDYGKAEYKESSRYNYRRPRYKDLKIEENIYACSLSVCRNAKQQPFKYVCKYFNIKEEEKNLENFEKILNDFVSAQQGKVLLINKRDQIVDNISNKIPKVIKIFSRKKMTRKLGFDDINFGEIEFPIFIFKYVSAGGNSSMSTEVKFDFENLEKFISYLSEKIKFRKSVSGQRALMTRKLREKIKERDNYTCQKCGVATSDEAHLLLEIDHIQPLSKGGLTEEENLQTLCWKCNRKKGAKLES